MASVVIPTRNPGASFGRLLDVLTASSDVDEIIVIDSASADGTPGLASKKGARVIEIKEFEFDHGGTRTLASKEAKEDIIVFLTQDVMPVDGSGIANIVDPIKNDKKIGACYGRQIACPGASIFSSHLRSFNFGDQSQRKSLTTAAATGFKSAFLSNSFCAYSREALDSIGWFKEGLIMCEDFCAGASLLLAGYDIYYSAQAVVYHAHDYGVFKEARRYFDIGVLHGNESWILDKFGAPESEGIKFVKSEMREIISSGRLHLLPVSAARNSLKFLMYNLGKRHSILPGALCESLSDNPLWWRQYAERKSRRTESP